MEQERYYDAERGGRVTQAYHDSVRRTQKRYASGEWPITPRQGFVDEAAQRGNFNYTIPVAEPVEFDAPRREKGDPERGGPVNPGWQERMQETAERTRVAAIADVFIDETGREPVVYRRDEDSGELVRVAA